MVIVNFREPTEKFLKDVNVTDLDGLLLLLKRVPVSEREIIAADLCHVFQIKKSDILDHFKKLCK